MSTPAPIEEPKLSASEQKKKAKAEKQARRAAQKEQQDGGETKALVVNGVNGDLRSPKTESTTAQQQKPKAEKPQKDQQQQSQAKTASHATTSHHKRTPSQLAQQPLPVRSAPTTGSASKTTVKKDRRQVDLVSHLYIQSHRQSIEGADKDVHPAVLALGFQLSSYEICGSSARCVAMLLAFKEAIKDYSTPTGTALPRHLEKHYLGDQITFLVSCRPLSESMGNAIRWLKKLISNLDPDLPEQEAIDHICESIDTFIRERITITDQAIAATASPQIKDGSVVLTYAKSFIVEKTILEAHANGTNFRVITIDSRPLFEGKNLATSLMHAGLEVEYLPFSAISHAVKQATVVLLGAHSMLGNGRLKSRIGTASVAMQAFKAGIPVLVCCESVKFSGRAALNSIEHNEVAAESELVSRGESDEIDNLKILNLMYDVTPAEYIKMVICEYGSIPASSVPVSGALLYSKLQPIIYFIANF